MYSREERIKAIKLYLKYGCSATAVINELGYPCWDTLNTWYKEYLEEEKTGIIKTPNCEKYTKEQKEKAVAHYIEHGRNFCRTVREIGYPNRNFLKEWCDELRPDLCKRRVNSIQYSKEQKKEVIISFCRRQESAEKIANKNGVSRSSLYVWKNELLGKEKFIMKELNLNNPLLEKKAVLSELESLKQQIKTLQLEKDILEGTIEILKKDPGANLKNLTNKEKVELIDTLKTNYALSDLLKALKIAKSSYYYQKKISLLPNKYEYLYSSIKEIFNDNFMAYGYRRIRGILIRKGIHISEKIIRRIMLELKLVIKRRGRKKYSSYLGESMPSAPNLVKRNFHSDEPNKKWLTDITEFSIPKGKIYLSPIIDCFDGLIVSWAISTTPDADLVNSMLDCAIKTLKEDEHPLVHSDRGSHYRWTGWISRMNEAGLERSMSKKGYSPDNAACEGLFGRVKNEMFYNKKWFNVTIDEFIDQLNNYIIWYNETRIKLSLGNMSPVEYRRSLGIVI